MGISPRSDFGTIFYDFYSILGSKTGQGGEKRAPKPHPKNERFSSEKKRLQKTIFGASKANSGPPRKQKLRHRFGERYERRVYREGVLST